MHGDKEGNRVDAVTDTTEGKGSLDTQTVDEGTSEETNRGEGAVKSGVLE